MTSVSNSSEDIVNDFIKAIMILISIFSVLFVIVHFKIFSLIFFFLIFSICLVLFVSVKAYKFWKKNFGRWTDAILSIFLGWLAWSAWVKGDDPFNYNGWFVALGYFLFFAAFAFFQEFLQKKE